MDWECCVKFIVRGPYVACSSSILPKPSPHACRDISRPISLSPNGNLNGYINGNCIYWLPVVGYFCFSFLQCDLNSSGRWRGESDGSGSARYSSVFRNPLQILISDMRTWTQLDMMTWEFCSWGHGFSPAPQASTNIQ